MIQINASSRLKAAAKPKPVTTNTEKSLESFWNAVKEGKDAKQAKVVYETGKKYLKLVKEFAKLKEPTDLDSFDTFTDWMEKAQKLLPDANAPWKNLAGSKRLAKVVHEYAKITPEIRAGLTKMIDYCKEIRFQTKHLLDDAY